MCVCVRMLATYQLKIEDRNGTISEETDKRPSLSFWSGSPSPGSRTGGNSASTPHYHCHIATVIARNFEKHMNIVIRRTHVLLRRIALLHSPFCSSVCGWTMLSRMHGRMLQCAIFIAAFIAAVLAPLQEGNGFIQYGIQLILYKFLWRIAFLGSGSCYSRLSITSYSWKASEAP